MTADISKLAYEIADESAVMDIHAYCVRVVINGRTWFNSERSKYPADDQVVISRAATYLEGRKKLVRHAQHRNLVSIPGKFQA